MNHRLLGRTGMQVTEGHLFSQMSFRDVEDTDERLILEWQPWQDAVRLAETGGIRDAKSIVGLFWLARVMADRSGA